MRNRTSRPSRWAASLALVAGGAFFGTACQDAGTPPIAAARKTMADSADQIAFGMRTLITDRGLLRAEVLSDTAYFFDENTRLEMRGGPIVRGVFFNSVGAKDAVMTSRTGLYSTRTQMLEARGDVVVTSVDGRRLETPFLRYDNRVNQISSDSAFVLTEPDRVMRGIGFTSDPDMQNIRVLHVLSVKTGPVEIPEQ